MTNIAGITIPDSHLALEAQEILIAFICLGHYKGKSSEKI